MDMHHLTASASPAKELASTLHFWMWIMCFTSSAEESCAATSTSMLQLVQTTEIVAPFLESKNKKCRVTRNLTETETESESERVILRACDHSRTE